MSASSSLMSPRLLLISFLIVAGAFALCWISWYVIALALAAAFFPETFQLLTGEPLVGDAAVQQVAVLMPLPLFWSTSTLHLLVCVATGWGLVRMPLATRRQHVVFVALLLCLTYLQAAVQVADGLRWMPMVQMSLQPLAVLAGAYWFGTEREAV